MAVKWIKTNYPGMGYYEHPERLYRGRKVSQRIRIK